MEKNIKMYVSSDKGITLIALVITIIVLLLLAGVSIAMLTGENGILIQAMEAEEKTGIAESKEKFGLVLNEYEMKKYTTSGLDLKTFLQGHEYITKVEGDTSPYTVTVDEYVTLVYDDESKEPSIKEDIKTSIIEIYSENENITVTDEYRNDIVIPAGFGISSESGNDITEGIVIEDPENGNQFVWIPVGTVYGDGTEHLIELSRYEFESDGTANKKADDEMISVHVETTTDTLGITKAKDLEGFKTKTNELGGYYLARYEASNNNGVAASKGNVEGWVEVTQAEAATAASEMYQGETKFTTDLANSLAWDTAIVYIQTFSGDTDYSQYRDNTLAEIGKTGETGDEKMKIFDMSANLVEWSTETSFALSSQYPCIGRGSGPNFAGSYTSYRTPSNFGSKGVTYSFRVVLYMQ